MGTVWPGPNFKQVRGALSRMETCRGMKQGRVSSQWQSGRSAHSTYPRDLGQHRAGGAEAGGHAAVYPRVWLLLLKASGRFWAGNYTLSTRDFLMGSTPGVRDMTATGRTVSPTLHLKCPPRRRQQEPGVSLPETWVSARR